MWYGTHATNNADQMSHNANASDTINKSVGHFSKRDQLEADEVGILHDVEAFPCDEALIYSVKENSVKNVPMRNDCEKLQRCPR